MYNIIIWGSGEDGQLFFNCLDKTNVNVMKVVDNNKEKWGGKAFDDSVSIISPDDIRKYAYDYLCICTVYKDDILKQCRDMDLLNCLSGELDAESYMENAFLLKKSAIGYVIRKEIEEKARRVSLECNWRDIFHDTVDGYDWYNVKSLSLGRWAIGYEYAYVMARILNWLHPKYILECGLGQSTKIINSYISYYVNERCQADVVEQDKSWIDFFCKDNKINENVSIHNRALRTVNIDGNECFGYCDFESVVKNKKYSLISIDGPWGGDYISRIDILEYLPEILEDDFVIMIDDYERVGEKNTVNLFMKKLLDKGISVKKGMYRGEKDICVIVPENMEFLLTL